MKTYQEHVISGLEQNIDNLRGEHHHSFAENAQVVRDLVCAAASYILTPDAVKYAYSLASKGISNADMIVSASAPKPLMWFEYKHIPGLLPEFFIGEEVGDESDGVFGVLIDNTTEGVTKIWSFQSDNPHLDEISGWPVMTPQFYGELDHNTRNIEVILTPELTPPWSQHKPNPLELIEIKADFQRYILNDCTVPIIVIALMSQEDNGLDSENAWQRQEARRLKRIDEAGTSRKDFSYLFPKKISLSKLGQGHISAMPTYMDKKDNNRKSPNQHWVRGHFMKFSNGNLSWRKPHLRGNGVALPTIIDK